MALVKWIEKKPLTPWSTLDGLTDPFDRLWTDMARLGRIRQGAWSPAVDVRETQEAYTLEADVPGLKKEDISITVSDDTVTLKGERKSETESNDRTYHRVERTHGAFTRSFRIPDGFDHEKVKAHYDQGVLTVTLPKREEAKPKRIDVKVT